MRTHDMLRLLPAAFLVVLGGSLVLADDEPKLGWSDTAEFSLVVTGGNSKTETVGFKNTARHRWDKASFTLNAGGIYARTDTVTREAFGPDPSSYVVVESSQKETKAESYYLNGRYDREISKKFFWFAGAGWDRNRPSGIDNRSTVFGGVGNTWFDTEKMLFKTDYSGTWTDEQAVVLNPATDDKYFGLRLSWTYWHKFGSSTTYGNDFVVNENLDQTSDFRADMTNWVAVSMSKRLALKVSLQLMYDNEPALETIPLFDDMVTPVQVGTVDVPLDDLDTVFTASLVVNF